MPRKSEYCRNKKGRRLKFDPDLQEWIDACKATQYNYQMYSWFGIARDTFSAFLDREHYKEEQNPEYHSAFLASLKKERNKIRAYVNNKFLDLIEKEDTAAIIFGQKTYNKFLEAKDKKNLELKAAQVNLQKKQFLTQLAEKFDLNYEQLQKFADKYFVDNASGD